MATKNGDPILKNINDIAYVETLITFQAVGSGAWEEKDLSGDGIPRLAEVEVLISNSSANAEKEAGVRSIGSSLERKIDLHEAEAGGVTPLSIHVKADANSKIEVYAETNTDIDFIIVGYRS